MTNPHLALRAEQTLVGALLQEPRLLEEIGYLRPDSLTHPTYQALYAELAQAQASYQHATPEQLPELVADRLKLPGVDAPYLRSLTENCPEPGDISVYARMIQEAFVRAELASHVDRIAARAGTIRGVDPQLDQLDRLAQALARQGAVLETAELQDPAPPVYSASAVAAEYETPADERARQEDLILADLLQNREQVVEIEVWLSPENFTAGPRREVYEAILAVAEAGEPVNELTVAWELDRQGATEAAHYVEESEVAEGPVTAAGPDYLATLVSTAVVVGVSVEIGTVLFTEDLRVELAVEAGRIVAETQGIEQTAVHGAAVESQQQRVEPLAHPEHAVEPAQPLIQPPPIHPTVDTQPKPRP